jgi:hypothetical protein
MKTSANVIKKILKTINYSAKKKFFLKDIAVVEIRMKSAAAGKTRFFDPPRMIFAA